MNNARMRNCLIVVMVCVCSSFGMTQVDSGVGKPVVDTSRWIVNADAHSVAMGINRYILRPGATPSEMSIFVIGNLNRMAWVDLDSASGFGSVCMTMLATGNQLDVSTGLNSIDVGWNSMTVLSVDDGEVAGSMDGILEPAALDVINALVRDKNLKRFLSKSISTPAFGYDCNTPCRNEYPRLNDCEGSWDAYVCCMNEARYDHCRRICDCHQRYDGAALAGCESLVSSLFLMEATKCAADFWWFLN